MLWNITKNGITVALRIKGNARKYNGIEWNAMER